MFSCLHEGKESLGAALPKLKPRLPSAATIFILDAAWNPPEPGRDRDGVYGRQAEAEAMQRTPMPDHVRTQRGDLPSGCDQPAAWPEAGKAEAAVPALVIDHIEEKPTEN